MMEPTSYGALDLISGDALSSELRVRRSPWLFKTVALAAVDSELDAGWELVREGTASARMRRAKPIDQALEDDVWALLARIGFTHLNAGRRFKVPLSKAVDGTATKQIDVLAADDETALVVECKASSNVGVRSLAKDLGETNGLRASVVNALRQHFGVKQRVGWLYATRNIVWGPNDLDRATEFRIRVLTDNDIDYFMRLADLIGPAARHQLQAEIFSNQQIEALTRTVPAVRGKIAGKRFYQFAIEPEQLLKIAFISHRVRLDSETVGAYQRMLRKGRLRQIREYIEGGGTFPTNIVVNFRGKRRFDLSGDKSSGDVQFGSLYLPNTYKSAWIIDGQHRLYGFAGTKWAASTQLPVLAFQDLKPSEEAQMFVDINSKQVRVPRNLLVDLMSELYWDSDQPDAAHYALLSRIVAVLGSSIGSPVRNRMVQEGDTQSAARPLTITGAYEAINKSGLVGTLRKGVLDPGPLYEKNSEATLKRSVAVLTKYLRLYSEPLQDHWDRGNGEGGYLCTNNGITALLLVLAAVVKHLDTYGDTKVWSATPDELIGKIKPFVQPVVDLFGKSTLTEIKAFRRQVGNVGQRLAAMAMMEEIHNAKPGFAPDGLDEYIKGRDQTGTLAARQVMPELQLRIQKIALRLLVHEFGEAESGWWRKGVPEIVRKEIAARREASPDGGPYEQYFELLDYRAIASANWTTFEPFYAFGEGRKSKAAHLEWWFSKLNEIRNRIAHPERGPVSDDELTFLEELADHFDKLVDSLP
jgi:DNA sulfur modification protein DndB